MLLTKIILASYAGLVFAGTWHFFRTGLVEAVFLDLPGGLLAAASIFLLDNDLKKGYVVLTSSGAFLSAVYFIRLLRFQEFYPAGFLWLLSMMVFLLCLIKNLQFRGKS